MRIGPFFHSSEDTEYEVAGIAITLAETEPFDPYGSSWTGIWIYKDGSIRHSDGKEIKLEYVAKLLKKGIKNRLREIEMIKQYLRLLEQ